MAMVIKAIAKGLWQVRDDLKEMLCEHPCLNQWWLEVTTPYDYQADYIRKLNKLENKVLSPYDGESPSAFFARENERIKTIQRLRWQIADLESRKTRSNEMYPVN